MEVHGAPSENWMPSQVHMGMMNSVLLYYLALKRVYVGITHQGTEKLEIFLDLFPGKNKKFTFKEQLTRRDACA